MACQLQSLLRSTTLASLFSTLLLGIWALHLTTVSARVWADERPNVLVILSDDQGWGDLSVNGNANLQTPNVDSLARDGASFERFYVCPVCSPTRAEFLTGRYHPRSGVYSTSSGGERMDLDERTIADTFRSAGYTTAAFGKWHNGMQYPYHPCGRGFDEFYGFCSGHWGDYFSPPLELSGRPVQGNGFCIDDFTDHAIDFMQRAIERKQPFFAYLPYNTPHAPMQVPDAYWERFKDKSLVMQHREQAREDTGHTRAALAMCENIDWNVGRLLAKLDDWHIADNTIVLYFCDNGPNGARWNGDMKGRKGSTDEGGVRSPLLIRWPEKIAKGKLVKPIAGAIDLLPTLADLVDIPLIGKSKLDGTSLKRILLADSDHWPDRQIISHWNGKTSVRNQRFRLDAQGALFEIDTDPGQRQDVASAHPAIAEQMQTAARQFMEQIRGFDDDQRPFLLGHREFKYTQIPARDGIASGNIMRSNKFPNCSYFTNWISPSDQIHWDVRVAAAGRYQVDMQYACPAADIGSTVELTCGPQKLVAQLTQPHDPPLRGQEHDRVLRTESYVKDFGTLDLGTMQLEEGDAKLTLRASEIPGSQALEFRLLLFTRVD